MQFSFADHTLDTDKRELRRGSEPIAVEPQVFDLLIYLVEHRDRVVSKDDLIASVWGGRIVSELTMSSRINAARKAIGDSGDKQTLIRTVARKGLRFVGAVHTQEAGPHDASGAPADAYEPARPALPLPDRPAIAVLPFTNMSGDPEQEYFSDGISEDIVTALSKLRWFFVNCAQLLVRLQGQGCPLEAGRQGTRRRLCGRGQRAQERRACAHHRPAQRCDHRQPHLGGALRPRPRRRVCGAGRDHRSDRRRNRTEALCGGTFPRPPQAAGQHGRVGSRDAGALALLAGDPQDNVVAQALLEKAIAIDPNYGQALGLLSTSHTFSAHMGWEDMATAAPSAERAALAAVLADGEDAWAHCALGCAYLFKRRLRNHLLAESSKPRCGLIPISRWRRATTAWRWPIAGAARTQSPPRSARYGSARATRSRRSTTASPPMRISWRATTKKRSGSRARASGSAAISSAPIGC